LKLFVVHVGPIHVPSPVLAEVKQLDESAATSLGLRVVEPELATAIQAANLGGALCGSSPWLAVLLVNGEALTSRKCEVAFDITRDTASRDFKRLIGLGVARKEGRGRSTCCVLATEHNRQRIVR
jgi:hypothetical protein